MMARVAAVSELYCTFLLVLRNSMLQEEFATALLLKDRRYLSRQGSGIS